jgi:hypothetical protein
MRARQIAQPVQQHDGARELDERVAQRLLGERCACEAREIAQRMTRERAHVRAEELGQGRVAQVEDLGLDRAHPRMDLFLRRPVERGDPERDAIRAQRVELVVDERLAEAREDRVHEHQRPASRHTSHVSLIGLVRARL